jgi:hypothetical protein
MYATRIEMEKMGMTALMIAASCGDLAAVMDLIEAGADVNEPFCGDKDGYMSDWTAACFAIDGWHEDIIEALFIAGDHFREPEWEIGQDQHGEYDQYLEIRLTHYKTCESILIYPGGVRKKEFSFVAPFIENLQQNWQRAALSKHIEDVEDDDGMDDGGL